MDKFTKKAINQELISIEKTAWDVVERRCGINKQNVDIGRIIDVYNWLTCDEEERASFHSNDFRPVDEHEKNAAHLLGLLYEARYLVDTDEEIDSEYIISAFVQLSKLVTAFEILLNDELFTSRGKEALRKNARNAALIRVSKDPRQKAKMFVHECWIKWRSSPTNYTGKAAFARDMLIKCSDTLTSQKKIEDWCREWEKTEPIEQGEH